MILWHQKHTDFPGPGKTETNIRGSRIWPQYALKAAGLMMMVAGITFGLAGFFQINPVWLYGPYTPFTVSAGSQPDWYVAWLDGSLTLWPHWEFRSFGHEIANPFFPGLLIPGFIITLMYAWPWIDKKIYHDHRPHNLLNRPRDKPFRSGVGVASVVFFTDLTLATGTDVLANNLHIGFERLIEILQYFPSSARSRVSPSPRRSATPCYARPPTRFSGQWAGSSSAPPTVPTTRSRSTTVARSCRADTRAAQTRLTQPRLTHRTDRNASATPMRRRLQHRTLTPLADDELARSTQARRFIS
jgi:hypothetical protein